MNATPMTAEEYAGPWTTGRETVAAVMAHLAAEYGANACWEWPRSRNRTGYGVVCWQVGRRKRDKRSTSAHRLAWMAHTGQSLGRLQFVCHRCDNPPCINPAHLFVGSPQDNTTDMIAKGRQWAGPRPGRPRLLSPEAERIAALDRRSLRAVAYDYGVTSGTVARWRREHRPTPTGRAEG